MPSEARALPPCVAVRHASERYPPSPSAESIRLGLSRHARGGDEDPDGFGVVVSPNVFVTLKLVLFTPEFESVWVRLSPPPPFFDVPRHFFWGGGPGSASLYRLWYSLVVHTDRILSHIISNIITLL